MNHSPSSEFAELERRRVAQRRRFYASQPQRVDNVIAKVVQRKGYAQIRTMGERDTAWQTVAEDMASLTQLGNLRRGVLEVLVANSLVMQELTFRKEELLHRMQKALPDTKLKQIKFRLGQINE